MTRKDPELRLPPADLFLMRARRLEQLSEGHALGDYLRFVARLAHAQQAALDAGPAGEPPAADRLAQCREYQMPPLAPAGLALPAGWRDTARQLAQAVKSGLPAPGQTALEPILSGEDAWLDAQAVQLFEGHTQALDAAIAPVIGAALQVHWSHLARQLHPAQVARPEHPNLCPVWHCTLCNSEWHVVRAKCSNCDNTRDIACYHLEGKDRLVQAESCPECQTYLKVIHQEKDPQADPVADDLATLTLDLLMDEAGFARSGINWYLIHGPA
ncbi:MAG: formate dehydrogenase accessory protein FdhE [Thiobacillus sp.]|nr:formate dehydrogenase accessory protein FdhE [Thiobacillus sp.]